MSREFKLTKAPYDKGDNIYSKATFTFEPGITILVGCNGSGKTTLITLLKEKLDKLDIPYYEYDNYRDGGSMGLSRAMFNNKMEVAAQLICSSEGEKININMGEEAAKLGNWIRHYKDKQELWIFFDAIDSGLSIDNICDVKEYLFNTILNSEKDRDVYIICSANAYEFANGSPCMDINLAKYITFKDYEDYKQFILKSKEHKDKRYLKNK